MPQASAGNVITTSSQVGTGVVTTTGILDGTISNIDISGTAAIAIGKLSGVAASGANNDITSLGALSTKITTAQGGLNLDTSANAQGGILYLSATGVWSVLAVGTNGQFLKTQGASANPVWAAASTKIASSPGATAWQNTDTSERTWFTTSVPGGTLGTGNVIRLRGFYEYVNGASTATKQIKLKYGATTIFDSGALTPTSASITLRGFLEIVILANGSTSAQTGFLSMQAFTDQVLNPAPSRIANINGRGTAAIDSTSAQNLLVTIQDGAGNSVDFFRIYDWVLEVLQ